MWCEWDRASSSRTKSDDKTRISDTNRIILFRFIVAKLRKDNELRNVGWEMGNSGPRLYRYNTQLLWNAVGQWVRKKRFDVDGVCFMEGRRAGEGRQWKTVAHLYARFKCIRVCDVEARRASRRWNHSRFSWAFHEQFITTEMSICAWKGSEKKHCQRFLFSSDMWRVQCAKVRGARKESRVSSMWTQWTLM